MGELSAEAEYRAAPAHRPAVFYSAPAGRTPYFAPYCSCGWYGASTPSRKRAFREANGHAPNVDTQVRGLEARGVPAPLRSAASAAAETPYRRDAGDAEGLIRVVTVAPHRFRRLSPPERLVSPGLAAPEEPQTPS
jgi:hypothetical protein